MRLLVLIVIGIAGYYGWQAYQKDPNFLSKYLPNQQTEETQPADSTEAQANTAEATASPSAPAAPAAPVFVSKIAVPAGSDGTDQKLPPGQFLMLERVSVETNDGVTAVVAGDLVKLIERRPNGTLRVTNGKNDFVVKESQVTQEVSVARDAEKRAFQLRYGAMR
jgi:hypothetical protein